jgi:hypothetical protein
MPGWVLKLAACLLTGVATAGSAGYVTSHLKSPSAPLNPRVVASGPVGRLTLTPSIRSSADQQPLTFTSVS